MYRVMRPFLTAIILVVLAGSGASLPSVSANGDSVEVFRGTEGSYDLTVGAQPARVVVGTVHLTVTPRDAETLRPVNGATIEIVANDPDDRPAYQTRAVNSPAFPQYYDANLTIGYSGTWTLVVTVRSDELGEATFAVPLEVQERRIGTGLAGTLVWVGILLVLSGGGLWVWHSTRRIRSPRQDQPGLGE